MLHAKLMRFHNLIEEEESEAVFSNWPSSGRVATSKIVSLTLVSF
jgi:hypothetical protein